MSDDRAIYIVLVAAGVPPLIGELVHGGALGIGATVSLLMVAVGIGGLIHSALQRIRPPRARVVTR